MNPPRPIGITILALLFFLAGVGQFLGALGLLLLPGMPLVYLLAGGLVVVLFGALSLVIGWGLWSGHNWARILAIIYFVLGILGAALVSLGMLLGLAALGGMRVDTGFGIFPLEYFIAAGSCFSGLIPLLLVVYLFTGGVRRFFQGVPPAPPMAEAYPPAYAPAPAMPAPELPPAPPPLRPVMPPPAPMPPPSPRPAAPLPYTVVPEAAAPPTQMAPEAVPPTVAMQKPEAPAARLVGTEGALAGKRFDLFHSKTATLGRDPHQVTILLEDTTVSRHHADIRFENGRFIVADQNALNGTFVNNQRVQGLAVLSNGDAVRFGNVTLKFEEV